MFKFSACCVAALVILIAGAGMNPLPAHAQQGTYTVRVDRYGVFPGCPTNQITDDDGLAHRKFDCSDGSVLGFVDIRKGDVLVIKLEKLVGVHAANASYGTDTYGYNPYMQVPQSAYAPYPAVPPVSLGDVLAYNLYYGLAARSQLPPDYSPWVGREPSRNRQRRW